MGKQVGGNHYLVMAIEPLEYITANNLGFCEGNIIKYVSRYKNKGGIADLKKAQHYLELLIAQEQEKKSLEEEAEALDKYSQLDLEFSEKAFALLGGARLRELYQTNSTPEGE